MKKLPQHFSRMEDGGAKPGAEFGDAKENSSYNYGQPKGIGGKSGTPKTWQGKSAAPSFDSIDFTKDYKYGD